MIVDLVPPRKADLGGGLSVARLLPRRQRRMVGPWCFLDAYGPLPDGAPRMDVAPHPHVGLQTVSWLVSGSILHRDSLGSEQLVAAGALGLMTAGRAIAHSEESPGGDASGLQGVQLWVALPDAHRATEPSFEHHAKLPVEGFGAARATIFYGSLGKSASPARRFSPALGAEVAFPAAARTTLPVDPGFEHAVLLLRGRVRADGVDLPRETLAYVAPGSEALVLEGDAGSLALVLGGAPFGEEILMWWNFVARTPDEMAKARADWEAGRGFGEVPGYAGARLPAPPLRGAAAGSAPGGLPSTR